MRVAGLHKRTAYQLKRGLQVNPGSCSASRVALCQREAKRKTWPNVCNRPITSPAATRHHVTGEDVLPRCVTLSSGSSANSTGTLFAIKPYWFVPLEASLLDSIHTTPRYGTPHWLVLHTDSRRKQCRTPRKARRQSLHCCSQAQRLPSFSQLAPL
jgi:hypothetical protein